MRCIEFPHIFFLEFQILESEFQFDNFSTAEFKKKCNRNLRNWKRNQNSASDVGPRNQNWKLVFPTKMQIMSSWSACGGITSNPATVIPWIVPVEHFPLYCKTTNNISLDTIIHTIQWYKILYGIVLPPWQSTVSLVQPLPACCKENQVEGTRWGVKVNIFACQAQRWV